MIAWLERTRLLVPSPTCSQTDRPRWNLRSTMGTYLFYQQLFVLLGAATLSVNPITDVTQVLFLVSITSGSDYNSSHIPCEMNELSAHVITTTAFESGNIQIRASTLRCNRGATLSKQECSPIHLNLKTFSILNLIGCLVNYKYIPHSKIY